MALLKGNLFQGDLFSGQLLGGTSEQVPEVVVAIEDKYSAAPARRRRRRVRRIEPEKIIQLDFFVAPQLAEVVAIHQNRPRAARRRREEEILLAA